MNDSYEQKHDQPKQEMHWWNSNQIGTLLFASVLNWQMPIFNVYILTNINGYDCSNNTTL